MGVSHEPLAFAAGRLSGLDSPGPRGRRRCMLRRYGPGRDGPGRDGEAGAAAIDPVPDGIPGWSPAVGDGVMRRCVRGTRTGLPHERTSLRLAGSPSPSAHRHASTAFVPHSRDSVQDRGGFLRHSGSHLTQWQSPPPTSANALQGISGTKGGNGMQASLLVLSVPSASDNKLLEISKWPRAGRFQVAQNAALILRA